MVGSKKKKAPGAIKGTNVPVYISGFQGLHPIELGIAYYYRGHFLYGPTCNPIAPVSYASKKKILIVSLWKDCSPRYDPADSNLRPEYEVHALHSSKDYEWNRVTTEEDIAEGDWLTVQCEEADETNHGEKRTCCQRGGDCSLSTQAHTEPASSASSRQVSVLVQTLESSHKPIYNDNALYLAASAPASGIATPFNPAVCFTRADSGDDLRNDVSAIQVSRCLSNEPRQLAGLSPTAITPLQDKPLDMPSLVNRATGLETFLDYHSLPTPVAEEAARPSLPTSSYSRSTLSATSRDNPLVFKQTLPQTMMQNLEAPVSLPLSRVMSVSDMASTKSHWTQVGLRQPKCIISKGSESYKEDQFFDAPLFPPEHDPTMRQFQGTNASLRPRGLSRTASVPTMHYTGATSNRQNPVQSLTQEPDMAYATHEDQYFGQNTSSRAPNMPAVHHHGEYVRSPVISRNPSLGRSLHDGKCTNESFPGSCKPSMVHSLLEDVHMMQMRNLAMSDTVSRKPSMVSSLENCEIMDETAMTFPGNRKSSMVPSINDDVYMKDRAPESLPSRKPDMDPSLPGEQLSIQLPTRTFDNEKASHPSVGQLPKHGREPHLSTNTTCFPALISSPSPFGPIDSGRDAIGHPRTDSVKKASMLLNDEYKICRESLHAGQPAPYGTIPSNLSTPPELDLEKPKSKTGAQSEIVSSKEGLVQVFKCPLHGGDCDGETTTEMPQTEHAMRNKGFIEQDYPTLLEHGRILIDWRSLFLEVKQDMEMMG